MISFLLRLFLACTLAAVTSSGVVAAVPSHVTASLVAADTSIEPGRPVLVALRLVHDATWHTYWKNPGTGLPTTITWHLPPGWTAGEIQWPAPQLLYDSRKNIVGHGFEGEVFLPVTLTPPTDLALAPEVTITAAADWLMCQDLCIPGKADLALTLPVAREVPKADSVWSAKIHRTLENLPRPDPAWTVTAAREGKAIRLRVTPARSTEVPAQEPHFFSEDGLIPFDAPQSVVADGKGGFVFTLPVSPDVPTGVSQLKGVVASEAGWWAGGRQPALRVDAQISAVSFAATAPAATATSLVTTLFLAVAGGLILNLMPCVFPVLGIKILGFVNQAGHQRRKVVAHGLTFTLGVLVSFWSLAGVLAILRAGGDQLGWGFQLQSPVFVYGLALLMLVFALNMSGVFEFGLRATAVGGELQSRDGYAGSFFTGILATVVATPCSAPVLAPALGAALAVSTVESFTIFTAIGLGLSMPYLLLSIFPAAVKMLPRPGAWMETFKQFMAFPLYATTAFLMWVLAAQTSEEGFRGALFSLVLVAMAVWSYGRWTAPGASPGRVRLGVGALVFLGTVGIWSGWPRGISTAADAAARGEIVWEPWSPESVARYRAEGRSIYVDFTARWCATCQTNKKLVFASQEVKEFLARERVVTLRGDWTNKNPQITAELAAYQRSAVPFNVIWLPGRASPAILPELLTPGIVLEAFQQNVQSPAHGTGN